MHPWGIQLYFFYLGPLSSLITLILTNYVLQTQLLYLSVTSTEHTHSQIRYAEIIILQKTLHYNNYIAYTNSI